MENKNGNVVIRIFIGLVVWFSIYKLYATFVSPVYENHIPVFLNQVINSMVVPYTIALGAFYLIVRGMKKGKCNNEKMTVSDMAKAFVIQSGFSILPMMILNVIMMILGFSKSGIDVNEIRSNLLFYVILLLLFNPIFEELLFRRLMLDRLLILGEKQAVILCAALFALPHLFSVGLPNMVNTFVLGLVWSFVTVKTGKLWPAIILHSLSNLYGAFFPMVMTMTMPTTALFMLTVVFIMPTVALVLLIKSRKRLFK